MGAGQIGGIASLLDIDFKNAAGFIGNEAGNSEAQFVVYFLSHAMLFCAGALVEANIVLTPAACIFGERSKFEVFGGTHDFIEHSGSPRTAVHVCVHKGYNRTLRGYNVCALDNVAILVLEKQFHFDRREPGASFIINRVRYGIASKEACHRKDDPTCAYFGWGSRRNGYMLPLLLHLFKVEAKILPKHQCENVWHHDNKYLCLYPHMCKDDVGSVLVCSGFLQGLMATRLVDRPCGVGWLDMVNYIKFLTCAVDDAQDLVKLDKETILMEIPTNPIISVTRKPTETEPPEPREL